MEACQNVTILNSGFKLVHNPFYLGLSGGTISFAWKTTRLLTTWEDNLYFTL